MDSSPESPIEDIFENKLLGFLDHDAVTFKRQHEIQTPWGHFRLDFILIHQERRISHWNVMARIITIRNMIFGVMRLY